MAAIMDRELFNMIPRAHLGPRPGHIRKEEFEATIAAQLAHTCMLAWEPMNIGLAHP